MTYRMESAKPPPPRGWGYSIDYDAEIANDEREIAYLSGEACKTCAAAVEARLVAGDPYALQMGVDSILLWAPETHEALGLTRDEARQLLVAVETPVEHIPALFGPVADWRADWLSGEKLAGRMGPSGVDEIGRWRAPRESTRLAQLKRAKASLSRHKRNREKYGNK